MFDRLDDLLIRYEELMEELGSPEVASDTNRFRKLMKEQSDLAPIVETYKEYKKASQNSQIQDQLDQLEENRDEYEAIVAENDARIEELEQELKILLLPKDPNDEKNVIVEIRAGAGGDEAALFASELYRMYVRFAERNRWKTELVSVSENGIGGFKEVVFMITGQGAYSKMKYESGVHRVQRVPETETQGRIHTSTATVAVMPQAEEVDFALDMKDLRIDTFRSSGAGGQHINKTSSAIRVTHIPTGTVVECQNERSQFQNKDKALEILRSRLLAQKQKEQQDAINADRAGQVGTGDRSEKIRTYNFPQDRCTDHRIGLTVHNLDKIMDGNLDDIIDALATREQAEKLQKLNA